MKVESIDHLHVRVDDLNTGVSVLEGLMGKKFYMRADFTADHGNKIAFNPFPIGFELMEVTDRDNPGSRMFADEPQGVFAVSLKVPDIDEAIAEIESTGHKLLRRYEFGEVKEALFDFREALGMLIEFVEYPTGSITDADTGGVGEDGSVQLSAS